MPRLHSVIYKLITKLLALNTRVYGLPATRELLRDLNGDVYQQAKAKALEAKLIFEALSRVTEVR